MTTQQQLETLEYFRKHAREWMADAEGGNAAVVNVTEQRNDCVLRVANDRPKTRSFLDVGCGTGELVCEMAKTGVETTGVDYAPEMIRLALAAAAKKNLAGTRFACASIFDFAIPPESYDIISANGFIEYISQEQMGTFFSLVAMALRPGGSFVVGSRNRLYNILSMNEFTRLELDSGAVEPLLRESIGWANASAIGDVLGIASAPLQAPDTRHVKTGIDVSSRFQYTPLQLINLLVLRRLKPAQVFPIHIHGVPPSFKASEPVIHATIANLLHNHVTSSKLVPYASSFMLHVRKD